MVKLPDFVQRIIDEKDALKIKFDALSAFRQTQTFKDLEQSAQDLLHEQFVHMKGYLDTLEKRLDTFIS